MSVQSTPYYQYGYQRRYPFAWHGGPGGVPQSRLAAESRGLGIFDLVESGLDPNSIPFPAFKNTNLHRPSMLQNVGANAGGSLAGTSLGDWPLVRPAGPEPIDPNLAGWAELAVPQNMVLLAAAGALAWWLFVGQKPRGKARKNPAVGRYAVSSNGKPSMSFSTRARAARYADRLRRKGRRASVRKRR